MPIRSSPLIVALDTANLHEACEWARAVAPHCSMVKAGLELFAAYGPKGLAAVGGEAPLFLDLKLHDIPNTVERAVRALLPLGPRMLTVHASGGSAMIASAREAAEAASGWRPLLLAVTVLTSLDQAALADTGVTGLLEAHVERLGALAIAAGADGLVCSASEAPRLRAALGSNTVLVVPGIRPADAASDDQARVMTPAAAIRAGADWLVVGRPITGAPDPGAAAAAITAEITR
jgi:orotidine-5'-phosphate decarboxylase